MCFQDGTYHAEYERKGVTRCVAPRCIDSYRAMVRCLIFDGGDAVQPFEGHVSGLPFHSLWHTRGKDSEDLNSSTKQLEKNAKNLHHATNACLGRYNLSRWRVLPSFSRLLLEAVGHWIRVTIKVETTGITFGDVGAEYTEQ